MLGRKSAFAIAIVSTVLLAGISYGLIFDTPTNITGTQTGYLEVVNHTKSMYIITNSTQDLEINLTVYTSSSPIFVFDVSPLNNSSAIWQNISYFNYSGNYIQENVGNGSSISFQLFFNTSVVSQMKISNFTLGEIHPYIVKIIVLNENGGFGYFFFALARSS